MRSTCVGVAETDPRPTRAAVAARSRGQGRGALVALRRVRQLLSAFLFCSFFFAPALSKKKRVGVLAVSDGEGETYGSLVGRGLAPAGKRGVLLRDQKYQKSAKEGFSSSFANLRALARVCRRQFARRQSATTGAKKLPQNEKASFF